MSDPRADAATGAVKIVLRIEGLVVLLAAVLAYAKSGAGWGLFAATFLIPDLSLLAYFAGARTGSIAYNVAHSYIGAVASLIAAAVFPASVPVAIGLIWGAHIGFDRALGYGLKYSRGFGHTHLGLIGRTAAQSR
jgi:hypothetical protein